MSGTSKSNFKDPAQEPGNLFMHKSYKDDPIKRSKRLFSQAMLALVASIGFLWAPLSYAAYPADVTNTATITPPTGITDPDTSNNTDSDVNDFLGATVSGHLYIDTNNNGVQDAGEPDLANVDVIVTDSAGMTYTVSTDANGDWSVTDLPAGTTTADVQETDPDFPAGATQTEGTDPTTVTAVGGVDTDAGNDGYYLSGTVSGHLYEDTNGNGVQDAGEPDLANVDVVITDSLGNTQTVTTDANGDYTASVPPGDTIVDIDETDPDFPAGSTQTEGGDPTTVTAVAGADTTEEDNGFFTPGTVSGHLYEDTNGNGIQDPGEPDLANVDVVITDSLGNTQTVTTDANGDYTASVPPGDTIVDIDETDPDFPAGSTQTEGGDPTTVTAVAGADTTEEDNGFFTPGTVSGHLYEDTNGNGIQDPGEPDLANVDVVITDSLGNTQTVTTDANGDYTASVPPGDTIVDIDETDPDFPAGSTQTEGGDPTTVTAVAGADTTEENNGFFTPGTVSGHLYEDTNGNGIQDAGEPDLANVDVVITDSLGNTQTVTTDANGDYTASVPPGDTIVDIDETDPDFPAGSTQTEGGDPTTVTAVAGADTTEENNGFFTPGTVSGHLYEDTNGNGIQDPGEPDLANVDVVITDSLGNTQTVTTDANGDYTASVPPGDTIVDIDETDPDFPAGSTQTEGGDPTTVTAVAGADTTEENNGFFTPGTVSGHLYEDTNGNGIQDPGEPDLANVDVVITDSLGNTQTVTTDANGDYTASVPPGDTIVDIDETDPDFPAGSTQTEGGDPTTVTAVAGADTTEENNGFFTPGTVSGHLYEDTNGNGIQDPGEPDLANVDVVITDSLGNTQTVTTDANGDYTASVPPGDTIVDIDETDPDFPAGSTQTEGGDPTTVTAVAGADTTEEDNGFFTPGTVSGHLYEDTNGNGVQDAGEPDLANVDVVITDSLGNTQTVTTDANGDYTASVPPGDTIVDIDETDPDFPAGSTQTEGGDPTTVTAVAGADTTEEDNGFFTPGTVSGHLYEDTNGNGIQDPGEPDLANVDVVITDSLGNTQTVTTDANGDYTASVPPGDTIVDIDETDPDFPAGSTQTEGGDPTTVTAVAGADTTEENNGFFTPGTVSGHLYEDTNGNGIQDPGEPDLANVDVVITDSLGNTQTVTTDANGDYTASVPPGDTIVDIDETDPDFPAGSTQTEGGDPTTVTAVAGADTTEENNGFFTPGTVSGHLYEDTNGNGIQDPGEPDLANVDVVITDSLGNTQTVTTDANGDYTASVPPGDTIVDIDETDPDFPAGSTQTEGGDPTTVTAVAGADTTEENNGFFTPGTVSGHLYEDTNGNGIQDAGEPDLANVDVVITDSLGNTQTVTTDANGDYTASVPPGDTIVDIDETDPDFPAGSTQTEGGDPTTVTAVAGADTTEENNGFFTPNGGIELIKDDTYVDANGDGIANAGDEINYSFTVTNTGGSELTNIVVNDPPFTVTCVATTLAPGASTTCTASPAYVITQTDVDNGEVQNVATVTGEDPLGTVVSDDSDSANPADDTGADNDPTVTPLTPAGEIELQKTGTLNDGGDGVANVGDTIDYTFTVENTGNVTLTNVTVTDPLITVSGGPIASMAPGDVDTTTFTGTYTLTQADIDAGEVVNTATATGSDPDGNPVTDDSDDPNVVDGDPDTPTTTPLTPAGEIELQKTGTLNDGGDGVANVGDTIDYTFTVENTGNVTLTNVTVTDPLITVSGGPIASMAPGDVDTTTFTGTYTLTQADIDAGEVVNTATATGSDPDGNPVTDDSDDPNVVDGDPDTPTTTPLTPAGEIELQKTGTLNDGGDGVANVGDTIDYTFTVENTGNVTLTNVTVTDPLITVSGGPIASMAPGDVDTTTFTGTYTLTQADIDAGEVVNTATATGSDPDGNPVTDDSDDPNVVDGDPDTPTTTPLTPAGEIELQKTGTLNDGGDGVANVGDTIDYTFTVENTGNVTLTNVTVTDPLITVSGGPIASMAPGDVDTTTFTGTYTLTQADIDAGEVVNTATATGSDPDGNPVTDDSDDPNVVDGDPDTPTTTPLTPAGEIELQKTGTLNDGGDGVANVGDTIDYTFTVENTGNVTLTNVTVTDPLITVSGGPIASMAPGDVDTTTFTGTYTLTQADIDAGEVVNTATATGSDPDGNPVTDDSDDPNVVDGDPDTPTTTPLTPAGEIELQKTGTLNDGGDGVANVGDTIDYTFTVENTGNVTLTNVTVTDPLITVSGGPIASMAPGDVDTTTFTGTYTLTQADIDAGEVVNTATATGSDPDGNPVTDDSDDPNVVDGDPDTPTTTPLTPAGEIELQKTGTLNDGGDGVANVGDTIDYTFTVENTGNVTLTNVTVTDPLITVSGGPIASMAPGDVDTTTFTGTYTLTQADIDAGEVVNTATATGSDPDGNPVTDDSDDPNVVDGDPDTPTTTPLTPAGEIELQKTGTLNDGGDGVANVGDTIDYTFTVENTGNVTLTNVTVTDPLITVSGGPIASMAPGDVDTTTFTGTYTLTQADIDAGEVVNTATATGSDPDGNPVTDDSDDPNVVDGDPDTPTTTPLTPAGEIELQKTGTLNDGGDGVANVGDTIDYTFTVENTGNVTLTNVTVTDPLITVSGGPIASMAPGDVDTTTFTGTYTLTQADIDAGEVVNTATATGSDPDGNPVTDDSDDPNVVDGDPDTPTTTPLTPAGEIELQKTGTLNDGGDGVANVGDTIDYTFTVENTGNVTLTNVTVTDPLITVSGGPIASMAPGDVDTTTFTGTYTLTQADIDAGEVVNTATATGSDPDGNPVTDDSDDPNVVDGDPDTPTTTPLTPAGEIELQKTGTLNDGGDGVANVGDTIDYTFTVENTGNVTLTNVTVTDPLITVSGGPIASMAPGDVDTTTFTGTYTLTQADIDAGEVVNTATATGSDPDGNPVTDDSDDPNVVDGDPDTPTTTPLTPAGEIELQKTGTLNDGGDGVANVGDTIDYTFTVENTGNVTLTNVTVTDPLITVSGGPIASMAPGDVDTTTFTGTYTLTQADIDAGEVVNTATATGSDPDGNPVTDDSDDPNVVDGDPDTPTTTPLTPAGEIELQKTGTLNDGGDGVANVGDTIDYTFTVENTGNVTLTNVTVTDPLITVSGGPIASMAPGDVDTTTFTGTYTLTQADIDAGEVVNTATATGSDPDGNPVTDDSDDPNVVDGDPDTPTTTPLTPAGEIELQKTGTLNDGGDGVANVGDTIDYTFTVENTGNVTLTNVTVTDPLITVSGGPIASMAPGDVDTTTFTGTYTLTQADIDAGEVVNTATATGSDPDGNPVTDDSDDPNVVDGDPDTPTTTPLTPAGEIELQKTGTLNDGGDGVANVGDTIDYTFTVENTGNVTLTNVTVTDPLITVSGGPIASMAPGDVDTTTFTGTYTLTQADIDAGEVVNTATATGSDPDGNPVTDDSDDPNVVDGDPDTPTTTPLTPAGEIELQKTGTLNDGGDGVANVGDTIDYTFTVENTGNVTLTNVTVTDPLITVSGGPIASMAPGDVDTTTFTGTYTLTQADIDAGEVVNTATATGSDPDGNPVTDDSDDPNVVDGDPDTPTTTPLTPAGEIELQKTAGTITDTNGDGVLGAGDEITYTFRVENTGNVTLTNVTVTDPLVAVVGGPIASMAPGDVDTTTFTATYIIQQSDADAGEVVNQATVEGTDPDGNPVTDVSDDPADPTSPTDDPTITPIDPTPAIELIKSSSTATDTNGDGIVGVGDVIDYDFTVTNTGNVTVSNITLDDPTLSLVDLPVTPGTLEPGQSGVATAQYTLTQADVDAGGVINTATAEGTDPDGNPVTDVSDSGNPVDDTGANDDPTNTPLGPDPDIELLKASSVSDTNLDGRIGEGDEIEYIFTAENTGNVTLTNVNIDDAVLGITDLPMNPATLLPGETATATATYTITLADVQAGEVVNSAIVEGTDPTNNPVTDTSDDPNGTEPGPDDPTVTDIPVADLSLVKSVNPTDPNVGDTVTFTLTVSNAGPDDATGVEVTDQLPSGYLYQSDTSGGTYDSGTGLWTVGNVASGSSVSIDIVAEVNPAGDYNNVAEITAADQADPDSTPDNNDPTEDDQSEASTTPVEVADLEMFKLLSDTTPSIGSNVTFTLSVLNNGPSDATGVVVTDQLPDGYTYVSDNSGGSYDSGTGIWTVGDVAANTTSSIEIVATVNATGDYANTAEITSADQMDPDSTPGNADPAEDDQETATATPVTPQITIDDVSLNEGDSGTTNFVFTVELDNASTVPVTVEYTTNDGTATSGDADYAPTTGTVTFAPGETTATITVPVTGDTTVEADETFTVDLSNPTNAAIADGQGEGTIVNDDSPAISIDDPVVTEGDAGTTDLVYTVTLDQPSTEDITVDFSTSDGTATTGDSDYVPQNGTVTIPAGETSATITVPVNGDTTVETNETVDVNLSNPTNATIDDATGTGTIQNDDGVTLSIDDVTIVEGDNGTTNMVYTVSLSNPNNVNDVTVDYTTVDGTALASEDYTATSGTLTFPAGETTQTIIVPVSGDTTVEEDETYTVELSNPTNATVADGIGDGTIQNDDEPVITIDDPTVIEGDAGTTDLVFTVTLDQPSTEDVTVAYTTNNGTATSGDSDYAPTSGTVTIPAGETSATITVPVNGDTTVEPDETMDVVLSTPTNATIGDDTGTATIINDDTPTVSIGDASLTEGDAGQTNMTFTVSLDQPSTEDVTVDYVSADGTATTGDNDYAPVSGTVTIPAGETSATITVPVNGDTTVEADETMTVTISNPINADMGTDTGTGTILNDDSSNISIDDVTVTEGDSGSTNAVFTVTLDNPSDQPVTVDYVVTDGTATSGDADYVPTTGTVTFAPGETTATITVPVTGDTTVEADEIFTVDLSNPTNAAIADGQGEGTIVNDDSPAISIDDPVVTEGDAGTTDLVYTVTLDQPGTEDITVDFSTSDGTATTGDSDYVPQNGTVTIPAGETSATITVPVNGDTTVETNETVDVNLSNPTNATIDDATGTGTIQNDDGVTLSIDDVTIVEGDNGTTNMVYTVSLSNPNNVNDVTVDYTTVDGTALAGEDYTATSGTLTFPAGETTQTIIVPVSGDTTVEEDETYTVELSNPTNATVADGIGDGTIQNDDEPVITIDDPTVIEGDAGTTDLVFTVTLDQPSTEDVTVAYTTNNGTATSGDSDYAPTSGTVTIPAGETSATITVPVNGDTTVEPDETLTLDLLNPVNATLGDNQGEGTIANDDGIDITIDDAVVTEGDDGNQVLTFTVTLSDPSSENVTVDFTTTDGTATVGDNDYVAQNGTLVFAPGVTEQTISIISNGDTQVEPDEIFTVDLSNPSTGTLVDPQGEGTIVNDDGVSITIDDVTIVEGDSGTTDMVFTVTLDQVSPETVTVDYSTLDVTATSGEDYSPVSGTITFNPGETTATITVPATADTTVESDENFLVELSNPTNSFIADGQGEGTIIDDDLPLISIDDPVVTEGDAGTTDMVFTVTLDQPALTDITIDYTTTDGTAGTDDYTTTTGTITIPAGETTGMITVPVTGDTTVEDDETLTLTLSNPSTGSFTDDTGEGTIVDDDQPGISVSDPTVVEGNTGDSNTLDFVVTLDQPSNVDVTVEYTTTDGTAGSEDYTTTTGTVTIPAGETSATISVPVTGEELVEDDETVTLTLSNPTNADLTDSTGTGTITNDDVDDNTVVAEDDSISTPINTPVAVPVLANDFDPENDTFEVTSTTDPANGSVTLGPDGTVIYTPDPDFTGTDTFEYTITDENGNTDTATVTVTVTGPDDNSVTATADSAVTQPDTPVTVDVLENDFDDQGDTFTLTGVEQPANGTVVINPDGTITYTPDPGFTGEDTFVYTITDENGAMDTAIVTVIVNDDIPQAVDDAAETPQNTPVIIPVLDNDSDPQDQVLTVVDTTQPANGTITVNPDGTITYTPNDDFSGYDNFTYTISDPDGNTDIATVVVYVPPNGTLSGTAWLDADIDEIIDPNETLVEGWPVQLLDADGNLIGEVITDVNGFYQFDDIEPADGYTVQLVHPETGQVFVIVDNLTIDPGENQQDVNLPIDPSGVVYDAETRQPVAGAVVSIINDSTGALLPDECLAPNQQSQTTGTDGFYQFDVFPGAATECPSAETTYRIVIDQVPTGYQDAPSTLIPAEPGAFDSPAGGGVVAVVPGDSAPQVGEDTTYYFLFTLADGDADVVHNHIPLDPIVEDTEIVLRKSTQTTDTTVGGMVRYTITAENVGTSDLVDGNVLDTPAAGFNYIDNSVRIDPDQDNFVVDSSGRTIEFNNIDIPAGETVTISYVMRVGAGVTRGDYVNRAIATDGTGTPISNEGTASIRIAADPDIDETTIIGKVFNDRDGDGYQDSGDADGVFAQGGFAADTYVANSTTIDYGNGPQPVADRSSPLLRGINVGALSSRINLAAPAPYAVIKQRVRDAGALGDMTVTTAQGTRVTHTAAGGVFEDHYGMKAKGLTAQDIQIKRSVTPLNNGEYELAYTISNAGITEAGIPGVRLATVEGLLVETDAYGRYHLAGIDGGRYERGRNFILKVDPATLPRGTTFTTENPRVMRITGGLMNQFDFGVQLPEAKPVADSAIEVKLGEVFFTENSSTVASKFEPMLQQLAERLRASDGGVITIAGHGYCPAPAAPVTSSTTRGYSLTPHFDTRKSVLKTNDKAELDRILNEWRGASDIRINAVGHTDSIRIAPQHRHEYKDNYELSRARAAAVAEYVRSQLGLSSSQIVADGKGPDQPVASNATADGRAQNRRVELSISGRFATTSAAPVVNDCKDLAQERAQRVYEVLKPYLGNDICKVSFRSNEQTYALGQCGGAK